MSSIPQTEKKVQGLSIDRRFTDPSKHPYDNITWEKRTAQIVDANGKVIFEQEDVEAPQDWSQTATNITASKYFYGKQGSAIRESSVRQMIDRVVSKIVNSGYEQGYFAGRDSANTFSRELTYLLVNQYAAFNSPVWFNVGCDLYEPQSQGSSWHYEFGSSGRVIQSNAGYSRPQCSACFINSVEDSMESIMELARTEAMLFKYGSGTGTNLSPLRSSKETVSGGGVASGPLSFMRGYDAFAGVIKSGGKTRRAAKMVMLNVDHPDVEAFIECKSKEEEKAFVLMAAGYDGSGPDSEAYSSIFYQNSNNSVRVSDTFMQRAIDQLNANLEWELKAVKDGRVIKTVKAHDLLHQMAEAAWRCGDPGIQFDTTINHWHTSDNSGRINASNPCSEYMFLDDTACNLASLNLTKFLSASGKFDTERFTSAVEIMILAQDILVDMSGYPTERIARNSHDYRPLGLGYANLGALLMALGIPYDSDEGRSWAACITSIMTGVAYAMSARIAGAMRPLVPCGEATFKEYSAFMTSPDHSHRNGACPGWFLNKQPFSRVMLQHRDAASNLPAKGSPPYLREAAAASWHRATGLGLASGFRNSQVTVLAPTGTIGFLMDCDTTGIEPELALVKYKKLVGGGLMKIVNEKVSDALFKLGFNGVHVDAVLKYISETGTIEGAPFIKDEHLPVFDCSFRPQAGKRSIAWSGHIAMMAAVQPFLSGAISKTVNMPEESTVEDVEQAYIQAWVRGLKSIAIYRDGSKRNQVLTTKRKDALKMENLADLIQKKRDEIVAGSAPDSPLRDNWGADQKMADPGAPPPAIRHRLPDERQAVTHKFNVSGHEGYVTIGLYANGEPGEMFIQMAKEGSTISGLMDAFATMVSVGLQHGVPLQTLIGKFGHMRFEPSGWSHHPGIGYAKSLMDYIFRWLDLRFVKGEQTSLLPAPPVLIVSDNKPKSLSDDIEFGDSPSCQECGAIMVRSGSCYKCLECGSTSGCS